MYGPHAPFDLCVIHVYFCGPRGSFQNVITRLPLDTVAIAYLIYFTLSVDAVHIL